MEAPGRRDPPGAESYRLQAEPQRRRAVGDGTRRPPPAWQEVHLGRDQPAGLVQIDLVAPVEGDVNVKHPRLDAGPVGRGNHGGLRRVDRKGSHAILTGIDPFTIEQGSRDAKRVASLGVRWPDTALDFWAGRRVGSIQTSKAVSGHRTPRRGWRLDSTPPRAYPGWC